jgi:hypothetical protein
MIMDCICIRIFSSTIKENILFGKEYNHKLFQRVIHTIALDMVGTVESAYKSAVGVSKRGSYIRTAPLSELHVKQCKN